MTTLWLYSFKKFMMIPRSTNSEVVFEMIGTDLPELVARNSEIAAEKWTARKERREPNNIPKPEEHNYLKGIPNEWCEIIKQQSGLCPLCNNQTRNALHMETKHDVEIFPYKEVWKEIKEIYLKKTKNTKRKKQL